MTAFYEWQGNEFAPLIPDGMIPIPEGAYNSTERHVPWGDVNVLDLGGRSSGHFRARIRMLIAAFVSMYAEVGQVADLILGGITYSDAALINLTNVRMTPGGEYVLADADWAL